MWVGMYVCVHVRMCVRVRVCACACLNVLKSFADYDRVGGGVRVSLLQVTLSVAMDRTMMNDVDTIIRFTLHLFFVESNPLCAGIFATTALWLCALRKSPAESIFVCLLS